MRNQSSKRIIGFFPSPYPDELLYSICARFSTRAGYPGVKSVLEELFGAPTAAAVIDLPNRLSSLTEALPAYSSLTIDRIIDKHTLLPFFSAFLPTSRVKQLRDDLKRSRGHAGHMRSGIMASRIPMPSHLRFCPVCKREDEEYYGETYWHRLHQLPGVEVCPSHQAFLENSSANLRADRKYLQFISAEQATRATPVRYVDVEDRNHRVLLQLARDAKWLFDHPFLGTDLKTLQSRYLQLLIKRGLATYIGGIHVKRLLNEFSSHYSPALLKLLNCELRGQDIEKTNWLLRLVRPPKHAQHPLYHLLLIQFLSYSVEEFFQLPEELSPFGEGPWLCLNLAAEHYRQPVIIECQLSSRLRYGMPIGKFSCACGFAYARTGPDSSPEDRFRVGRVISFGRIWEAKLIELWRDSSLSISEIGRQLGVDPLTARRHAARLKLPFSGFGRKSKSLKRAAQLKGSATTTGREKKRRIYCSKWLSVMKRNPNITMKVLRQKLPREYAWLLQNDSEWLKAHKPLSQRRNPSTTSVDWKKRDAEYAAAVKATALHLMEAHDRPVQVTKTAIGRAIGAITLLQQKLHKMPLTAQVLASVVETREQYAVRRVWWAADLHNQEGVPRKWQLVMKANVYSLGETSAVKCAVDEAMKMLESGLSRSHAGRAAS
jgi:hypothetical protein